MTTDELAARGLRVKPLVWETDSAKGEYPPREAARVAVISAFDRFSVTKNVGDDGWTWFWNGFRIVTEKQKNGQTINEAKAAAEAYLAARIAAMIEEAGND